MKCLAHGFWTSLFVGMKGRLIVGFWLALAIVTSSDRGVANGDYPAVAIGSMAGVEEETVPLSSVVMVNRGRQEASGGVVEIPSEEAMDRTLEVWENILLVACLPHLEHGGQERCSPSSPQAEKGDEAGGKEGGAPAASGGAWAPDGGNDWTVMRPAMQGCAVARDDLDRAARDISTSGLGTSVLVATASGSWVHLKAGRGGIALLSATSRDQESAAYPQDRPASPNHMLEWVRERLAMRAVGQGASACDACRVSLEAMHSDWGRIAEALSRRGAVDMEGGHGLLVGKGADAAAEMQATCKGSQRMKNVGEGTREACLVIASWHAETLVRAQMQLTFSWCSRSGRGVEDAAGLAECSSQWASKVTMPFSRKAPHPPSLLMNETMP